jgi:hypothetical protein
VLYIANQQVPLFRAEKAAKYKLIMREFARLQITNSKKVKGMWVNVMEHHSRQAQL